MVLVETTERKSSNHNPSKHRISFVEDGEPKSRSRNVSKNEDKVKSRRSATLDSEKPRIYRRASSNTSSHHEWITGAKRKMSAVPTALKSVRDFKLEAHPAMDYEFQKFTSYTTFHGLVRLYQGKHWLVKLFWFAVVGTAVGLFLWQTISLFQLLNQKPTVSEVRLEFPKQGTAFPVVTICNYNPVKNNYVQFINRTGDFTANVFEYILLTYLQVEDLYAEYTNTSLRTLHDAYMLYLKNHPDFTVDGFFVNASQPCNELILDCQFGGRKISNCCSVAQPILTDIGLCYQFRKFYDNDAFNRQYISGTFYGLQLILNANISEYPAVYMNNFFETGIKFLIHTQESIASMSSGGLSVSPGRRLYAGVTPKHFILLAKEAWGTCKMSWEAEEDVGQSNINYTASNCEKHCIAHSFYTHCNCTPLRYRLPGSEDRICTPLELYNCIQVNHWDIDDEEYWYKICDNCVMECDRWEYDVQTSYVNLPNNGAASFFMDRFNLTEQDVSNNVVVLNVYLKDISYTEYEQKQATSFLQILSEIGGNMGLFLGMSAITVAEVSVFFIKLCWAYGSEKRRTTVVRKKSMSNFSEALGGVMTISTGVMGISEEQRNDLIRKSSTAPDLGSTPSLSDSGVEEVSSNQRKRQNTRRVSFEIGDDIKEEDEVSQR